MTYGRQTRLQKARRPLLATVIAALVVLLIAAGWRIWREPEREFAASIERGHDLAQLLCARCHAVGGEPESARPDAPPFRTLIARLTVDGVDDMLAESIALGHDPMPEWQLSPGQIEDLTAYLISIDEGAE